MDKLDIAIIDILQCDGRASNAKIARIVGVSEGSIRRRLNRLKYEEQLSLKGPMIDEELIDVLIKVCVIAASRGSGRDFQRR